MTQIHCHWDTILLGNSLFFAMGTCLTIGKSSGLEVLEISWSNCLYNNYIHTDYNDWTCDFMLSLLFRYKTESITTKHL